VSRLNPLFQSYKEIVEGEYGSLEQAIAERLRYASTHVVELPEEHATATTEKPAKATSR